MYLLGVWQKRKIGIESIYLFHFRFNERERILLSRDTSLPHLVLTENHLEGIIIRSEMDQEQFVNEVNIKAVLWSLFIFPKTSYLYRNVWDLLKQIMIYYCLQLIICYCLQLIIYYCLHLSILSLFKASSHCLVYNANVSWSDVKKRIELNKPCWTDDHRGEALVVFEILT